MRRVPLFRFPYETCAVNELTSSSEPCANTDPRVRSCLADGGITSNHWPWTCDIKDWTIDGMSNYGLDRGHCQVHSP